MPGVERHTVVQGFSADELYAVVTDYPSYPRFFTDFTRVSVLERRDGLWTVEFAAQVIREVSYTLAIQHEPERTRTRWTFVRGSLVSDSTGGWTFSASGAEVRIDYQATLEVNAPLLPGFIKKRIEGAILERSIGSMFDQLTAEARRRRS